MEMLTLIGQIMGVLAVFGGAMLEGLHIQSLLVPTAAIIVLGGTFAAVFVSYPQQDVVRAFKELKNVYQNINTDVGPVLDEIINVAGVARKEGVLAIEAMRSNIENPMFRKAIKYVIDGFEPQTVKDILDAEIDLALEEEEAAGRVWEGAGGYSPTIGIIGAVLGLIHVMQSLDDPSKIGGGIAVAFVATVYGVALANLVFIPWGTKIKRKAQMRAMTKEVVKLGVIGIQEGLNPHFLREKLQVYVDQYQTGTPKKAAEPPLPA